MPSGVHRRVCSSIRRCRSSTGCWTTGSRLGCSAWSPGVRVSVPLRSAGRLATGFVIDLASQQDYPGPLSDIEALVSPIPVLRPEVWRLARAVADRAAGSANDVLRLAIPTRQVRVEKAWLAADEPATLADSPSRLSTGMRRARPRRRSTEVVASRSPSSRA